MKDIMAKIIGGETEIDRDGLYAEITDTGRSSLRLAIKSGLKNKRFLIPDYLCEVIINVLKDEGVSYDFYKVNSDLTSDFGAIKDQKFDVLYVINYFGHRNPLIDAAQEKDWIVIEDNVFSPVIEKTNTIKNWISFNSLRKVSFLADGSLMRSTIPLKSDCIVTQEPEFSGLKYEAKKIKFDHLNSDLYSEDDYVRLLKAAEAKLDQQRDIHSISKESLIYLLKFYSRLEEENSIKRQNRLVLEDYLQDYSIALDPQYFSYYVLSVNRRDELRQYLADQKIFLAVHWPKIQGVKNDLYDRVISIPTDSRYTAEDMQRIAQLILKFMGAKHD